MSEGRDDTGEERTPPTGPEKNDSVPVPSEGNGTQRTSHRDLVKLGTPMLDEPGPVWVRMAPSQVVRTVAVALLTAAVVLGGLYLFWQVRTLVGWFVVALFLAAVLDPPVKWLERRHRMVKRSIAIILTDLGVLVGLVLIAGIFAPVVVQELRQLIDFIVRISQAGSLE